MAVLFVAGASFAQQTAVKEAKKLMGGSFGAAQSTIAPALTNPETKDSPETWNIAGQIQKNWVNNLYQKSVLQQPYDTAQMYNSALAMTNYFFKCDELAQVPDAKGKINNKYRNANAKSILENRSHLLNGGINSYNQYNATDNPEHGKKAVEFFGTYVESAGHPMLEKENLMQTDENLGLAAFYACVAAERVGDWASVAKYATYAENDAEYGQPAAELAAEALKQSGDDAKYLQALKDGAKKFPENRYFLANAVTYYTQKDDYNSAIAYINDALSSDPNNSYKLYIKGVVYAQQKNYDEAIAALQQSANADNTNAEAYSMIGDVYRLKAQDFSEQATTDMNDPKYEQDQNTLKGFYSQAKEPYEKARQLKPEERQLWLNGLYTVYYNLGMQSEFSEIENLMNN